jgi:pimeloyl-ACP methyl ester carboxylesterase
MTNFESGSFPNSFEAQFESQIGEDIIDVSPTKPTGRTIFFVRGWNAKFDDYKNAVKSLVEAGRRVIMPGDSDLVESIDLKGLEEIDIIAHSVGAINSVLAALQDRRIKHLVLLNPPIEEKDPRELRRKYRDMLSFEGAKNLADVGGRKIVEMANTITSFDMKGNRQLLENLGTKVKSIHGVSDILFPPPETALYIDTENIPEGATEFKIAGNHLGIDNFIGPALKLLEQ